MLLLWWTFPPCGNIYVYLKMRKVRACLPSSHRTFPQLSMETYTSGPQFDTLHPSSAAYSLGHSHELMGLCIPQAFFVAATCCLGFPGPCKIETDGFALLGIRHLDCSPGESHTFLSTLNSMDFLRIALLTSLSQIYLGLDPTSFFCWWEREKEVLPIESAVGHGTCMGGKAMYDGDCIKDGN